MDEVLTIVAKGAKLQSKWEFSCSSDTLSAIWQLEVGEYPESYRPNNLLYGVMHENSLISNKVEGVD